MLKQFALCIVFVMVLTACIPSTPTVAPQPTATPPGYPAPNLPQPTATSAAAYPAATQPASTEPPRPTVAATNTPVASPTAAAALITYQDFEIVPAQITIPVNATVVFQIKSASGGFHQPYNFTAPNTFEAPANLGDGATYQYTFQDAGTTTLLCGYHSNMRATVVVTP
ncbi:MAG: hypothetical protein ACRDH2_07850 [Anaerolineales bacterium]